MSWRRYKERWKEYLSEMLQGHTLKASAERCANDIKTVFVGDIAFLSFLPMINKLCWKALLKLMRPIFQIPNKATGGSCALQKSEAKALKRAGTLFD